MFSTLHNPNSLSPEALYGHPLIGLTAPVAPVFLFSSIVKCQY